MPCFDIIRKTEINKKSFIVSQIYDRFDLSADTIEERFTGEISLPEIWNIGMIVGKSGTGKTTILNEIFGECIHKHNYISDCVVDDMPGRADDIFEAFQSVGFSTPLSWLKPFNVLSNGEKMRVELACGLLKNQDIFAFDEYTSVVDREVAKIGSFAIQRAVRKYNKKFIAVGCHFDVMEWLNPDWYFNTDEMKMYYPRGSLRRPKLIFSVREGKNFWPIFRKYHYLSHSLPCVVKEFVAFYEDKPVAFCAVGMFPHPVSPMYKISRVVVLPDYQGIGLAKKLLKIVGNYYLNKKYPLSITTSVKNFARSLAKSDDWITIHAGMVRRVSKSSTCKRLEESNSVNRNTYSFVYKNRKAKED